jgi:hypothetical protein
MNSTNKPKASLIQGSSSTEMPKTSLPPETWAQVMEHLDLSSVLSLAATCRATNRDATKLVTKLHITKSCQMHSIVGRRFRDAREIYLYSFVQYQQVEEANNFYEFLDRAETNGAFFDDDTIERAVLFLTNLVNPRRVFFGSYNQFTGKLATTNKLFLSATTIL